ncbi:stage II sporulation protein M [Natronolimnohabitans sp. A-GB9]|uniref:stage II sporulation protein M n=1 Tax=Natronolimnohabitans sp. A-GB9 TaxID=3069757 RepID=UPI0027B3BFF0|nr:stage II sporulation protein M [Natronolimnohabitans sp. A-GB9]MDQ2050607.1 stage II sporulation protein M [Natronolimnohabitans sp. A-GB9]
MSLSDVVGAAASAFRRRPTDLLPWYVLGAAVPAIARVVPFLAIAVGVAYLEVTGRLEAAITQFQELETEPPDPEADPDAFEAWAESVGTAFEPLFSPTIALLVLVAVGGAIVVGVGLYAAVSAGQLTACSARLRSNRGLTAGFAGSRRYWLRFLGLYLLELLAWIAVLLTVGIGTSIVAVLVAAATGSAGAAIVVVVIAIFVTGLALAAVRALFAFAPVAVVVDDTTAVDAVSNTVGFVRSQPLRAGFYYAVVLATVVTLAIVSSALALVNATAVVSLLTVLLVFPALDLLKTALYNAYRERLRPPATPERTLSRQFRDGIGRGWNELVAFVRETPGTHTLVVVLAIGSFWVGWEAAEPLVDLGVETSIAARLEGHNPAAATLEFFGNNWMVALTTALSGLILVLPAIVSLVFNGFVMGIYGRTEVDPTELLAFVVPHGVFEVPAIFVASALGIRLGIAGWLAYRGQTSRTELADTLERAFWVLVGIGILLAVAAVIEGFVSPYYYELLF